MKFMGERVKFKKIAEILIIPLSVLYLEILFKLFLFGLCFDKTAVLTSMFALSFGSVLSCVCFFIKSKPSFIYSSVVLAVLAVYFSAHLVYYDFFRSVFSWSTIGMAGNLTDFWRETFSAIVRNFYKIILCFAPFVLYLIFGKYALSSHRNVSMRRTVSLIAAVVITVISVASVKLNQENSAVFSDTKNDVVSAYRYYGALGGGLADLFSPLQNNTDTEVVNPYIGENVPEERPETEKVYGENKLDIDFETLADNEHDRNISEMHRYFATVPATKQNGYTGYFKGKNLIFLTLEGFSYKAIDPVITPTLYKMYNEGFKFENFYSSTWGGSTATGEYSNMTGNFYTTANCFKKSARTYTYSALGTMFRSAGYDTFAYHDHTYTYYDRNLSHPNFGYDFKGIGNGMTLPTKSWPRSDLEMAVATVGDYINSDKPFHTYYMTVSGHANYSWSANKMSVKHRGDIPSDRNYSENIKAYLACQIEVDLMLKQLCNDLKAAGKLDDTVFAMCCDHYPYALTDAELSELYGIPDDNIRNNFDLYRNAFVLWCNDMDAPVTVTSPCSSYDIAPTLYNLFGIKYDSRIITGTDILSGTENVVIINTLSSGGNWNWITEKGSYSVRTKKFTPADGVTMSDEEIVRYTEFTNQKVAAMRKYSMAVLDRDYYRYIFNSDGTLKT